MRLPPFDLHRARSVDEASEILRRHGDDAAVHCGGTELVLLLKLGFASYGHLVDIKPIRELKGIVLEDGTLRIGAAVTHREIERSPVVAETLPALAAMERRVANLRVRTIGTLGGNLCFSDPHSDPASFLLALEAEVECGDGSPTARHLPLSEFLVGPYQTALLPGELLTCIRIPIPPRGTRITHDKIAFHERPLRPSASPCARSREPFPTSASRSAPSGHARSVCRRPSTSSMDRTPPTTSPSSKPPRSPQLRPNPSRTTTGPSTTKRTS